MHDTLLIGWTTVDSEAVARRLGNGLVATRLAVCVQIDASVESVYRWEGAVQSQREWRLMVKFAAARSTELVAPAYLKWALGEND
jgi:periplasmic divalent cation tolerance protein